MKLLALIVFVLTLASRLYLSEANKAITVIGANGRTGSKVVNLGIQRGLRINAVTRNGVYNNASSLSNPRNLINTAVDITDINGVRKAVQGSSAVIFAASASKAGGTPDQIDKQALIDVAKACIEYKVPRLVVVSSGSVSKPYSPVYLFLNLFGGIMKAKIDGENGIRKLYESPLAKSIGYTIIRPGGLREDPPLGPQGLELNQGDDRSGRISRWDVAALCLESINSKDTNRVTFECYNADTAQPLANVGLSNIFQRTNKGDKLPPTGRERRGPNWAKLFAGLIKDS